VPTPEIDAVEIAVDPDCAGEPPLPPALGVVLFAQADNSISATTDKTPTSRTPFLNLVSIMLLWVFSPAEAERGDRLHGCSTNGRSSRFIPDGLATASRQRKRAESPVLPTAPSI
jgi:hypothetical protein